MRKLSIGRMKKLSYFSPKCSHETKVKETAGGILLALVIVSIAKEVYRNLDNGKEIDSN